MWIKVCGIRKQEDALAAARAGAQAVGFVFAPGPRQLTVEEAQKLASTIPRQLLRVGVFADERQQVVERIATEVGLDLIQLHGAEGPAYCRYFSALPWGLIKAWPMERGNFEQLAAYRRVVAALLLDSSAGGKTFPWQQVEQVPWDGRIILAGGLGPENVAQAIAEVGPWGVDASSSLESSPGRKDPEKIRVFVETAKGAGGMLNV